MKWKLYSKAWHDENNAEGIPVNLPERNTSDGESRAWKDGDYYNDGIVEEVNPEGYTKVSNSFGQFIWLKDSSDNYLPNGSSVALDHLIQGAYGDNGWHTSKGELAFYYLHPGKAGHPELYLLDQAIGSPIIRHTDGIPMIGVTGMGQVNNGRHTFN